MTTLQYKGSRYLRQRLTLSTVSGIPIKVTDIRSQADPPGLLPYEISMLRLLCRICDGTVLQIDPTGTTFFYKPGVLIGSAPTASPIRHACDKQRCITFYLEALLLIAPFCKYPLSITLTGVTQNNVDIAIDTFRTVSIPMMKRFGIDEGLELHVVSRGAAPLGGGEVRFSCPTKETIESFQWIKEGRVKRVRGVAFTTRVAPRFAVQLVDKARNVLNDFLPDVWIYMDNCKGDKGGKSPAFGISLVAETNYGVHKGSDGTRDNGDQNKMGAVNEERRATSKEIEVQLEKDQLFESSKLSEEVEHLGKLAAWRLLAEISLGGVVDTTHQYIPLFFMAVADENTVSQVKLCSLTSHTVQFVRHLRDFLKISFDFEERPEEGIVIAKCVGIGLRNLASRAS